MLKRDLSGLSHAAWRLELEAGGGSYLRKMLNGVKEMVDKAVC